MKFRPPLNLWVVAIEKGALGSPSTKVANFTYFLQPIKGPWCKEYVLYIDLRPGRAVKIGNAPV